MNMHMALTPTQRKLYEERKARQERIALAAKKLKESKEKPKLKLIPKIKEEPETKTETLSISEIFDDVDIKKGITHMDKDDGIPTVSDYAHNIAIRKALRVISQADSERIMSGVSADFQVKGEVLEDYGQYRVIVSTGFYNDKIKRVAKKWLAFFNGISIANVKCKSRKQKLILPRHVIWYAIYKEIGMSYPQIGRWSGGFDHTSVMFGVQKVQKMIDNDTFHEELIKWARKFA